MKSSTKKKISIALRKYHACARRGGCGKQRRGGAKNKRRRRVALTQVKTTRKKGRISKRSRAASKGQQTAARLLRDLEKKAAGYDKKYKAIAF